MALAYLTYQGKNRGKHLLKFDLGSSSFYTLGVAKEKGRSKATGIEYIDQVFHRLPVQKVNASGLGRGYIELPSHLLEEKEQYVQLVSYRHASKTGRAYSNIIKLYKDHEFNEEGEFKLPALGFSKQNDMRTQKVNRIPFQFSENKYSEQQFFQTILKGISSLLPTVLPVLGNLMGGIASNRNGSTNESAEDVSTIVDQLFANQDIIQLLQRLVQPQPNTETAMSASNSGYSEAKIAPAIAAILPFLGEILNSEAANTIAGSPQKVLQTITDAAFKVTDRELGHLEKLNPGVDGDNDLIRAILSSMTLSMISSKSEIKFRRIDSVQLKCSLQKVNLMGRNLSVFSKSRDLLLPLSVNTPKSIGKADVQIIVKDTASAAVYFSKKIKERTTIQSGQEIDGIQLSKAELENVPANRDVNLCISLIFKNTKGKNIGTHKIIPIYLVEELTVGRVLPGSSRVIPLNDIVAHRDFWHKVWEDDFKGETREINMQLKYYYQANSTESNNAQVETKILFAQAGSMGKSREVHAKLKSGFDMSLYTLNQLIPQISMHPSLNISQLNAIQTEDFSTHFDLQASSMLNYRGRAGDMAALWVFPELEMKEIELKRATHTDRYGQITQFENELIQFPFPRFIHFVGVKSDR